MVYGHYLPSSHSGIRRVSQTKCVRNLIPGVESYQLVARQNAIVKRGFVFEVFHFLF